MFPIAEMRLPAWVGDYIDHWSEGFESVEARMRFVVGLAGGNVQHGSGGPFGAAVFTVRENRLVAPGVNLVTTAGLSCAHAEIVALSLAQKAIGDFNVSAYEPMELVTSTAPCAMCLGAIPWSGVNQVVCGARGEDAEEIGFDEGAKPQQWQKSLADRGIELREDVERAAGQNVLRSYARQGGKIYNGA